MRDPYLQPYREAEKTHGHNFEVTLWANQKTQHLRFRIFTELCDMRDKRILDAGCSRGDFADYLLSNNINFAHYLGLDGLDEVIQYAQDRNLPQSEFLAGDFVQDTQLLTTSSPQIITISGTLNTMSDEQALAVLDAAFNATSETLLFNFLSDRVSSHAPKQGWPARRLPTTKILDWAFSRTPLIAFRQDYFPNGHDATVMMIKETK